MWFTRLFDLTAQTGQNHNYQYSLLAQSHNTIWFGGFLRKNNTSCFLLGTVSCVDELDIHNVWMEITPKKILLWGIVKVVNSELFADISKFVGDAVNLKIKFLGTVCMGKSCLFW